MHHATSPSSYNIKHFRFLCDRRAVWCVLSPIVFDNDGTGEKARWKEDARQKLYSAVDKAVAGTLSSNSVRHSAYKNASPLFDPDANLVEPERTKSTAFVRSYQTPAPKRIERRATVAASTALQIQHEDRKKPRGLYSQPTLTVVAEVQARHQDRVKGKGGLLAELESKTRGYSGT